MDFVDIRIADRTYKLRFVPDDIEDICTGLGPFQPPGSSRVTPIDLANMILKYESVSIRLCLLAGMKHMSDFKNLQTADVQRLLREHIKRGGQYRDFRIGIFKALTQCGLAEFAGIFKSLEDDEAQRVEDAAIDVEASGEEEPDTGNAPTASSPSRTTSLTPYSSAVGSGSST